MADPSGRWRSGPWALVGVGGVLAVACLVLAISWLGKPFPGFLLEKNMTVTSVYSQHWTGFQAGIQVGDQVLAVDGTRVLTPTSIDRLLAGGSVGDSLDYRLRREGREFDLKVATEVFSAVDVFTMFVMWWLLGLVFLALGAFVSAERPDDAAARAFMRFCAVFSIFSLTNFESVTTHHMSWINILALAFVGPAAGHLALRMPVTPRWIAARPRLAYLPLIPGVVLAALTLGLYGQPDYWKPIYMADTGLVGLGLLAIPLAAAVACFSGRTSAAEKAQGSIVLTGAIAGIVPTLVVTMAAFLGVSIPGSEAAYLLTLVFPAALAYAIVRWRLFDVEVVVKRTLVYALVTVALAACYFASTAGLMALFGSQNARWADVLAAAGVALAFAPLRDGTKRWVDRLFFRQAYDFHQVLADFSERARLTLDPHELLEAYGAAIGEALHPRGVSVRLVDSGTQWGAQPDEVAIEMVLPGKGSGGTAFLGPRRSDLPYKAADRQLVESLTGQLALCLENAELFAQVAQQERIRRELEIARQVQAGFLPSRLPEVPGVALAACTYPALEVGGDFYDVLEVDENRLAILVGDVSGKGVPAALLMAMTVMIFRSLAKGNVSPGAVLGQANDLIWLNRPSKKMFVTAFYAVLDRRNRSLTYANAGQPFPLTSTGPLSAKGMALGVTPGAAYVEQRRMLSPGEAVMFFSDGVEDAMNPQDEHFGGERLQHLADRCWDRTPQEAHTLVLATLRDFAGGADPFDDLTLLTLQVS